MLTMRLLLCLLLFWITEAQVVVNDVSGKIQCKGKSLDLPYEDTYKEHDCGTEKIYVKFRTCDNCIELDIGSTVGLTVGNLMATTLIAVAVYLVASHAKTPSLPSDSKSSDRQHLIPSNTRNRGANAIYQDLNMRNPKDEYDVLAAGR